MDGYDLIKLSSDLDAQVNLFLPNNDELDSSDFRAIDYINLLFPSANIDTILNNLKAQIFKTDREIKDKIHAQTSPDKTHLNNIKLSIQLLHSKISAIKQNATSSEQMVHDITKDIMLYDKAKKNLTMSITVLKRMQMVSSAVDQLECVFKGKQYIEAAQLLQAILELLRHFLLFKNVEQIKKVFEKVDLIKAEMRQKIFLEFDESFINGQLRAQTGPLREACMVIDVLEKDNKRVLIDWYCNLQLKDYKEIFRKNPEVAGLSDVSRRFAWIKRLLKTFDEEHANAFLPLWRVDLALCEKFCLETKKDISEHLGKLDADRNIDVKVLLQSLQTSMDFEVKVDSRFAVKNYAEVGITGDHIVDPTSFFYKIISSSFAPYLEYYIESENKAFGVLLEDYRNQPIPTEEESSSNENCVLPSSIDLFYNYRTLMQQFSRFSTAKPLLEMGKMFGKWLRVYADLLMSELPRDDNRKGITEDDIRVVCLMINTAEYCANTTSQLEEKILERINEEFKKKVTFTTERDEFINVTASGIKVLVKSILMLLEPALTAMSKLQWGAIESVGDQSEYVSTIATLLSLNVGVLRRFMGGSKYFKTFCDKFADAFLSRYEANIYKCKPVPEVGAEQMLLDTNTIKTILIQMTKVGSSAPAQPSQTYIKVIGKGISKIEMLLKTVMISSDPPEGLIDRYMMMYASDAGVSGFQKILELKGLRRIEQQHLIDVLNYKLASISSGTGDNKTITLSNPPPVIFGNTSSGTSGGTKLKEDFSKFFKTTFSK